MTQEVLDFKILRKPTLPGFSNELDAAPLCLQIKEATHFFKILLSHFLNNIEVEIGNKILLCIAKVLFTEKFTETFLIGNFALVLPYSQQKYSNLIFEILRILLEQSSDFFDEDLIHQFEKLIPVDPLKSLIIISIYSADFPELANPWPMIDLLFQHSKEFQTPELASKYASLLSYLYKTYPDFRQGRGKYCWDALCSLLEFREISALKAAYGGLYSISDGRIKVTLPIEMMKKHITYEELQDYVLTLLLSKPPNTYDRQLLTLLKNSAKTNEKATLALLVASTNDIETAKLMLEDSGWLSEPLPTPIDTLRIFLSFLKHKGLRDQLSELPDLMDFLKNILKDKKPATLAMISTIIRRINLDEDLVNLMSQSEILLDYFAVAKSCNDELADKSLLTLFATIAPFSYVPDYLKICDIVSREIINNGQMKDLAYQVAIAFCKHQKCVKRMKEKRLDAFYKKHRSDPEMYVQADTFLSLIGWSQDEPNDYSD